MRWIWRIAALVNAAGAVAAPQTFTIEQALSAPFPTELTASRLGAKVAWVYNERGAPNIWIAEGPAWKGRRLTAYRDDDGQEILGPRWSTDGRYVVFVRGEAANTRGEVPNPLSDPRGV